MGINQGSTNSNVRESISISTGTIANNARYSGLISLGYSYVIYSVSTSAASRVRIYSTNAKLNEDINRLVSQKPSTNSQLILDVVTSTNMLDVNLSPIVIGSNRDVIKSINSYISVQNLSGIDSNIAVTLNKLTIE